MVSTTTSIETIIDGVDDIWIKSIKNNDYGLERLIVIRTRDHETYIFKLRSEIESWLGLNYETEDGKEDWITPKVYKGVSMHEQGIDTDE